MQCENIVNTFAPCLADALGLAPDLANFIGIFLGVILVATFPLLIAIVLIWVERKFAARIQDRVGPNRVGPFGIFQPFADVIKLLGKEDITPAGADKWIYNASPVVSVMAVLLIWAVIPFTPVHVGVDLSIGALYFIAVASLGTLAVILAGWSSNNKYALLGAFRVVAQLISYEVPLALANITGTSKARPGCGLSSWHRLRLSCSLSHPRRKQAAHRLTCWKQSPNWSPGTTSNIPV